MVEAPAVDNNATVNGRIVSTQGSVIPNVAVRVFKENNATALNLNISSDNNGLFTIELNEDSNFTLQFMAEGYATQVLPIHTPNIGGSLSLDIVMIPRGVAQAVSETNTSTVMGNDGATVTVDAGVFVDSNGDVVTDNIVVTITPVDVSTPLGVATFPGNFAGIQEGETTPTPIVSYGVVEYQFTRNGEVLQLAQGETAQIEIPIYVTTHQNGTAIALGDVIPLWSLDEATGIWTQDGTGTVVASTSSPTGFALRATVNHFTWWNCDVSMNRALAIITVTAPQAGTAVIKARTDAYIGWRPDTVSTVIDVYESTYPLYIPSNAEVCFWAEITFNNGTTVTTQEVCRTATPSSTINVNLGLVSADLALAVTPYETITTEINQAAVQLIVLPTTYESSVTYSIVSGSLPTGVTLSSISATRAVIAGVPTQEGTFDVVIQGVDSDGTMATADITYSVVEDNTPPVITLLGNQYVSIDVNTPYVDAGATASDNVDGDITARIVKTIIYYDWGSEQSAIEVSEVNSSVAGTYQIDYDVDDTYGNCAETVSRYVDVIGCNVPPSLYLDGDNNVTLFVGASYTEFGATAYDCMERQLDVNITGDVNTSTVGTYTVTYTATDASGHVATVVRNIHVVPVPDAVPDVFMFTDLTNVNLYEWQQGSVNISGINAPTAVSIVNGEYSLDGGINWVSSDGNVTNGSTILVRHLSANAYVTSVDTNLTVGGITDTFTSTTKVFVDQPPVALIEYNETQQNKTVYVGGNLYVNTGGEDDVGIEYCKWEDNNHGVIVEETVDPAEQNLCGKCELYNAPVPTVAGNYIYTLTVRDTNGVTDTNELNITVLANSIPTVDIGADRNITEGTTLNIIATVSDDDGDDVTYQWSYGLKDSGVMMGAGSTLEFSHQFNTTGLYVVEFRVMDSHGASVTKQIDVNVSANVADTTPPVITLVGDAVVEVIEGGTYTESGATAIDDTDGDISFDIVVDSSTVDTTVVGSYTVTYNVQDNAGNDAVEVTRTVNVVVAPMPTLKIKAVDIGLNPVTIDKFGYTFELMTDAVAPITTGTDIVSFYGFIEGYSNPATDSIVLAVDNRYADGSQFQVRVKDSSGNIVGQSDIFIKSGNGAVNFGTIAIIVVEPTIEAQIVERHNVYRNLEFSDSNLTWDATLATHAQQWADYLATHYTAENRTAGVSPHANSFDVTTHGLPYLNEGENIAWTSNNQGYILDEPVDITIADLVRDNFLATGKSGAVDIWANEKAYYDYDTNSGDGHVVGHYTQIVWKNTTHVGCGKAVSMTNNGGTHVVCRYSPAGNYIGQKPY